jgi:hypothetical protein
MQCSWIAAQHMPHTGHHNCKHTSHAQGAVCVQGTAGNLCLRNQEDTPDMRGLQGTAHEHCLDVQQHAGNLCRQNREEMPDMWGLQGTAHEGCKARTSTSPFSGKRSAALEPGYVSSSSLPAGGSSMCFGSRLCRCCCCCCFGCSCCTTSLSLLLTTGGA